MRTLSSIDTVPLREALRTTRDQFGPTDVGGPRCDYPWTISGSFGPTSTSTVELCVGDLSSARKRWLVSRLPTQATVGKEPCIEEERR